MTEPRRCGPSPLTGLLGCLLLLLGLRFNAVLSGLLFYLYNEAPTPRPHPSHTPATPRPHPGHTPATPRLHLGCTPPPAPTTRFRRERCGISPASAIRSPTRRSAPSSSSAPPSRLASRWTGQRRSGAPSPSPALFSTPLPMTSRGWEGAQRGTDGLRGSGQAQPALAATALRQGGSAGRETREPRRMSTIRTREEKTKTYGGFRAQETRVYQEHDA